jgi:hypothetical protein
MLNFVVGVVSFFYLSRLIQSGDTRLLAEYGKLRRVRAPPVNRARSLLQARSRVPPRYWFEERRMLHGHAQQR